MPCAGSTRSHFGFTGASDNASRDCSSPVARAITAGTTRKGQTMRTAASPAPKQRASASSSVRSAVGSATSPRSNCVMVSVMT